MTNKVISPLRQRMIDDMTMRQNVAEDSTRVHPSRQDVRRFLWAVSRQGDGRGHPSLPCTSGEDHGPDTDHERDDDSVEVFLRRDAWTARRHRRHSVCPRAAEAASGFEPRGSCAAVGGGGEHQIPRGVDEGSDPASGSRAVQEANQQIGHPGCLLLLHPVACAIDQMSTLHLRARNFRHRLEGTGPLINPPVACTRNEQ